MRVEFVIPVRTVSEANQREHWGIRNRRKLTQQAAASAILHNTFLRRQVELPCTVRMVRYGQKALDTDNLAGSFKHLQDSIAHRLGVDDGDISKVTWLYEQQPTGKRQYFVKVEVVSALA